MPARLLRHCLAIVVVVVASPVAIAGGPATVTVTLSDGGNGRMSLRLHPSNVPAGPVEITIENESNTSKHEFLIVPWSGSDATLPYDAKTQQVKEDKLDGLQGVEDLNPRETVTARFILKPGRYIAFCNEPGHYHEAMRADLIAVAK